MIENSLEGNVALLPPLEEELEGLPVGLDSGGSGPAQPHLSRNGGR